MHYKLTRLLLLPTANKPVTTAEVFIANPPIDQESLLGKLFFVAEIESNRPAARAVLDFLATSLSAHYYQAEKISMREKMGTLQVAEIFEAALARVNADFELFCKRERIKIAPKSYAIAAGVIHESTLAFSSAGAIGALLLYPDRAAADDGKKLYKITPLTDSEPGEKKVRLEKLFGNLTEGKVPAEGYVVFSNEILPEYITTKHLSKIITTLPPQSAVEQIKNQLHKINNHVTFAALIIKNSKLPHIQRTIPSLNVTVTAHNSLERMQETEHATERYLSPAGTIGFGGLWQRLRGYGRFMPRVQPPKMNTILREKLFFAKKSRGKLLDKAQRAGAIASAAAGTLAQRGWNLASNPRLVAERTKTAGQVSLKTGANALTWIFRLPRLHQGLLAAFLIASALFAGNIYRQTRGEQTMVDQAQYQAALQALQQQHNEIRASLIYRNTDGARAVLAEAQEALAAFTQLAGSDTPAVAALRREQQEYLDTLSNVTIVTDLQAVAEAPAGANRLILTDTVVMAFAPGSTALGGFVTETGAAVSADLESAVLAGTRLDAGTAIVFGEQTGVIMKDDGTTESATGPFQRAGERLTAAASYNGRLYTVDAEQDALWRHTANLNSKEDWLNETIALDDATALAIDGYIYIGFRDGTVRRYLSGYQNDFELAQATPVLVAADRILLTGTSEDGFIYILERSSKRIVVFEKTGAFVAQYRFDSLPDVADFAVTADGTQGYVLGGGKIYEFGMKQKQ